MKSAIREALESMVWQFAYRGVINGKRVLETGDLSALEQAFEALGWGGPHVVEECGCEWPNCHEWASCGINSKTLGKYAWLCSNHSVKDMQGNT